MPKVISWSLVEHALLCRQAEWIARSARHTVFLPLICYDYYYHIFVFCWRYSNVQQSSFDSISSLLFLVIVLFNAPSQRFIFQSGYLCPRFSFFLGGGCRITELVSLVIFMGTGSAPYYRQLSRLINKWVTTLKRHGRIRQILLPSSPNN